MYGIVSQLRRAALSVALNIVEGFGRIGLKEKKRFSTIALGSLMEVDHLLSFSKQQGYLSDVEHQKLEELRAETGAVLWGFYRSL